MNQDRWKIVVRNPRYIVSEFGDVFSLRTGKMLSTHKAGRGYLQVQLANGGSAMRHEYVHQLVAEAFIGVRTAGLETMHLDSNKLNNYRENLAYGTRKQNAQEMAQTGVLKGTRNGSAKLTEDDVRAIRQIDLTQIQGRQRSANLRCIAKQYKISESQVRGIIARTEWAWME